ncbi:L-2-hydroxyglutarate oxidase [Ornithinibacillus massiliensis]|uniref:L-2-hydroxyglutarate oxidase n=1 Tax=Ornithinibacillus massiliensis TaxID=1944633 RepID=A0ABS5MGY1_9BACI|nr:L-2-hydroxyglutarate oxidase [Ornithinibacillus massiliensis]MBS3681570.1 L-2-hydroxyglutarate oxidase [Ornithinibacillus massiliensis]
MNDFLIIGGGIVGLSVGLALLERYPGSNLAILEKESDVAQHQTGHNSGVIHSGIYYKPGSYKARFAKAGNASIRKFCEEHDIPHDICGKIIVAKNEEEMPELGRLFERAKHNGLEVTWLTKDELLEKEPYVAGVGGIFIPSTGIVDYAMISQVMARQIRSLGGEIITKAEVVFVDEREDEVIVETRNNTYSTRFLVNCAGLHSDRIARMAGYHVDVKIFPFRGEYFELKEEKRHVVRNLIYPVPNPNFPFLGVHVTRMIDGTVEVGPNAVPGFKREAYFKASFDWKDFGEIISYPVFWKLGLTYLKEGMEEMSRSVSKKRFVDNLNQLLPSIEEDDLVPAPAGVRAQALGSDGKLFDDFFIIGGKNSVHVCNAPSPAATASLEIGKEIASRVGVRLGV